MRKGESRGAAREGGGAAATGPCEASAPAPRADLYFDDALRSIETRAATYLAAGAAVHFRGPAGVGKTTLAAHLADLRGKPAAVITGDGWLTAAHLVGDVVGTSTETVRDRFIHTVTKTNSATTLLWRDAALTSAMEQGWTLVYDEFTRSPAEANNPLLAALEERVLTLPSAAVAGGRRSRIVEAHPDFRIILTSNPSDYAAVKTPQDALLDRMVTFDLAWIEPATEAGVVAARSGLDLADCRRIVSLTRSLRAEASAPQASMRAAIQIARIVQSAGFTVSAADDRFVQLCFDVLAGATLGPEAAAQDAARERLLDGLAHLILHHCPPDRFSRPEPTEDAA